MVTSGSNELLTVHKQAYTILMIYENNRLKQEVDGQISVLHHNHKVQYLQV